MKRAPVVRPWTALQVSVLTCLWDIFGEMTSPFSDGGCWAVSVVAPTV